VVSLGTSVAPSEGKRVWALVEAACFCFPGKIVDKIRRKTATVAFYTGN
jgi:hypothetical protein